VIHDVRLQRRLADERGPYVEKGQMMRIAILDDDIELCNHVVRLVSDLGHTILAARSGKEMMRHLRQESFDLLLLDWEVPDLSGFEILKWVRRNLDPSPPVIMITSRIAEGDIVAGLGSGADDYITKPVVDPVLSARIEALLRRSYGDQSERPIETFGSYVFDRQAGTVMVDGEPVVTTSKEFSLALLLFRNLNRALSRSHIMESVWGHSPDLVTRTLDAHISKIRVGLSLRPERGWRLSSVYSFGYRLEQITQSGGGDAVEG